MAKYKYKLCLLFIHNMHHKIYLIFNYYEKSKNNNLQKI